VSKPGRYDFLDLFRGLVVLFMLQGHVFRALLESSLQGTEAFRLHEIFHGITAPAFLFSAGFAFAIATQRRWNDLIRFSPIFFRRVWRAVLIVIMGYALHLPFFSLAKTVTESTEAQWHEFLAFNVLRCIGVTLLFLRFLLLIVRKERSFLFSSCAAAIIIVGVTPFVWDHRVEHLLPPALAMAVSGHSGSYFPLFPNSAYLLSGMLVSWGFLRFAQQGKEKQFMHWLYASGFLFVGAGFLFDALPFSIYPNADFWTTSPTYVLIKFGALCSALSLLWFLENRPPHRGSRDIWMPRWLTTLGIESLFAYVVHLMLLYGWAPHPSLNMEAFWAGRLSTVESFIAFVGLTAVVVGLSMIWHRLKRNHPILMQGLYWWMGITFGVEFLTRDY
jgi:acyltransferase